MEQPTNETLAAAHLGAALTEIKQIGDTPVAIIPDGFDATSLEAHLGNPTRKRGTVSLMSAESFSRYVGLHADSGTTVYGSIEPAVFVAVLNDHASTHPGWGDHVAQYNCPTSLEWKAWKAANGVPMTQEKFAKFIEDNLPDIVEPVAADMLEISRKLEAKKSVNFSSGIRLDNGQTQLTYEEEIRGTADKGRLEVPEIFAIGVPVLEGGPKYRIEARLRYRIAEGGKLSMWFDLVRPQKSLEAAVDDVWKAIEAATGRTIFRGTPRGK